jgi:large subunit ribosomal protein L30
MTMLEITLTKGLVGKPATQRKVVEALGLTKYGSSVTRSKSPTIVGMVDKIHHLVTVKEVSGDEKSTTKKAVKKTAETKANKSAK